MPIHLPNTSRRENNSNKDAIRNTRHINSSQWSQTVDAAAPSCACISEQAQKKKKKKTPTFKSKLKAVPQRSPATGAESPPVAAAVKDIRQPIILAAPSAVVRVGRVALDVAKDDTTMRKKGAVYLVVVDPAISATTSAEHSYVSAQAMSSTLVASAILEFLRADGVCYNTSILQLKGCFA